MPGSSEIRSGLLARLARLCGIVEGYHDLWGNYHAASPETEEALLAAMGVAAETDGDLEREIRLREGASRDRLCEPVIVLPDGGPQTLSLATCGFPGPVEVVLRVGGREEPLTPDGTEPSPQGAGPGVVRTSLATPLGRGVHSAEVDVRGTAFAQTCRTYLAVCPARGYEPEAVAGGGRLWGVNFALSALRSERNLGVGDFADLRAAVGWAADLGADFVGCLPLHALFNESPHGISPYYPSSRLFLNPLHIAVSEVEEASSSEVESLLRSEAQRVRRLREAELVEHGEAWRLKREVLARCYDVFRSRHLEGAEGPSARGTAFLEWRRQQGAALDDFAAFGALREYLASVTGLPRPWQEWPSEYRSPAGPAVREFRRAHVREAGFHAYLQWLAHVQLEGVREVCRDRGMAVGLYLDLALGVDPSGADAWVNQNVLALGASAGCPPDPFSLLGQRWGVPPVIPERHRESGYALFREILRRNCSLAGALRIDHVLALWRLFWVPGELAPSGGAYVADHPEELLPLLRMVSQEERCLIVGEDLGTIPPEVQAGLMDSGFLSYRLLIFEKEWDGRFRLPAAYPRQALVSVATHDLPTLDGFWLGRDLEVKRALGRYPSEESAQSDIEGRGTDRLRLQEALAAEGLLPEGAEPAREVREEALDALAEAVHAFAARTPSALLAANLDDLLGSREMQNLPGTLDEHPNWRRKTVLPVEEWRRSKRASRIAEAIRRERKRA